MFINKPLALGTCHNSLIDFYMFVSFLSLGNIPLFILYTCESQYDLIFDWIPCSILYFIRYPLVLISGGEELEISIIGWHQTFYFVHMTFAVPTESSYQ